MGVHRKLRKAVKNLKLYYFNVGTQEIIEHSKKLIKFILYQW